MTRALVVLIPLAAVTLVATRYTRTWYFGDEWRVFERILAANRSRSTFEVYNGHLYSIPILAYHAQIALGLNGHALVWTCFCATLLACNVAVARMLWAAGVPAVASVVAGVVVTYFGPGAQLMTLEFQFGVVGAIALSFTAGVIALRRRASLGAAVSSAVVLLVATASDSGTAFAGCVFVGVLLALRWRDRWVAVALGPPVVAGAAVLVAARSSPRWSGDLRTEIRFGVDLVLRAAGGLAGGGVVVGAFLLAGAVALLAPAFRSGRVTRDARHCLWAGSITALVMTVTLATTRSGIAAGHLDLFNRYIPLVAVFLLIALLPASVSAVGHLAGHRSFWIGPVLAVVLAGVFLLNLGPLIRYRRTVEGWQMRSRIMVALTYAELEKECSPGHPAGADANPLGPDYGPGVTISFLRELQTRGAIHLVPENHPRLAAEIHSAACSPPAPEIGARAYRSGAPRSSDLG